MSQHKTHMRLEIEEIPQAVDRLLQCLPDSLAPLLERLQSSPPAMLVTIARGSSDHAATFLAYATELIARLPVASLGPSIASVYHVDLQLSQSLCLAISQSGQSPDIVEMAKRSKAGGALLAALTNDPASPLARNADYPIDIHAGPELSVAATKTFVNSLVAGLLLLACWKHDKQLLSALDALPRQLEQAIHCDWSSLSDRLVQHNSLLVLGRGPSMAIASEAALKFKETCAIHAESFSAAEVLHGPASMIKPGFPVLALASRDASQGFVIKTAEDFAAKGASVFISSDAAKAGDRLPFITADHPLCDGLLLIAAFYGFIEFHARRLGLDPDRPPNLKKITETV